MERAISHILVGAHHFRSGKGRTIHCPAEDRQAGYSHATQRWWIQLAALVMI